MKIFLLLFLILVSLCLPEIGVCDSLILQPGPDDGIDTYVDNQNMDTNNGTAQTIPVADLMQDSTRQISYSLIKFDIPSYLQNADVSAVTLELCIYPGLYYMKDQATSVYRITENWAEDTVTWNTMPSIGEKVGQLPLPAQPFLMSFEWASVDITDPFKKWQSAEWANFGLLIKHDLEGISDPLNLANFCSSNFNYQTVPQPETYRPRLNITTAPVPEPASAFLFIFGVFYVIRRFLRR